MSKTYQAEFKEPKDIYKCEVGRKVILVYGETQYHGIFRGMDDDNIMLKSTNGDKPTTLGFSITHLSFWLLKDEK